MQQQGGSAPIFNADSLAHNGKVVPNKIAAFGVDLHRVAKEARHMTRPHAPALPCDPKTYMFPTGLPSSRCRRLHVLPHAPPAASAVPDAAAAPLRRPVVWRQSLAAAAHSPHDPSFVQPAGECAPAATCAGSHALNLVLQTHGRRHGQLKSVYIAAWGHHMWRSEHAAMRRSTSQPAFADPAVRRPWSGCRSSGKGSL
jgi:hypothetical protein